MIEMRVMKDKIVVDNEVQQFPLILPSCGSTGDIANSIELMQAMPKIR